MEVCVPFIPSSALPCLRGTIFTVSGLRVREISPWLRRQGFLQIELVFDRVGH